MNKFKVFISRRLNILISITSICLITCVALSCNNITRREKFDHKKWVEYAGFDGPDRDLMAEYLIRNHKLLGLSSKKVFQLLGSPSNYEDSTKTYYELKVKYDMIDPISGKDLIIKFNQDSIVTFAKIVEWHKN